MRFSFKMKPDVWRNLYHRFMYRWIKRYKVVFFFLFLGVALLSGFQWYHSLDNYRWSDDQRKAYLSRTITETSFQEDRFQGVLDDLSRLREAHTTTLPLLRDLFAKKKKEGE